MHDRFVRPQQRWATIVMTNPGENEITALANRIKDSLKTI
jgi:hypothetical protein